MFTETHVCTCFVASLNPRHHSPAPAFMPLCPCPFQKEENIPIFVEWAAAMFKMYHKRIKMWATFNEPSVRGL